LFFLAGMQDTRNGASPDSEPASGLDAATGAFGLRAAEPADGVGANAPEDVYLRGLRLVGIAVFALKFQADELSINEDMVALVERVRDGLAEAVESDDAVPLGFALPLVVRVLPRVLGSD
jgi:hypothetical protein